MSDMELEVTNKANNGTELVGGTLDQDWGGNDYIFQVKGEVISPLPRGGVAGIRSFGFGADGIQGIGQPGVKGVGVQGRTGVVGQGGDVGVQGQGDRYGVEGLLTGAGIPENRIERAAVVGSAAGGEIGIGVMGISDDFQGVLGSSQTQPGVEGLSTSGQGVRGSSFESHGVQGDGVVGVIGFAKPVSGSSGVGVLGNGGDGIGVLGSAGLKGIGVFGASSDPRLPGRHGTAGLFLGAVIVHGAKSAAVPHPDGSHRLLYSLESPESWFEDFGEGHLKAGKVKIELDPDFANVVNTDKYHVFVTSYGDSHGLYVTNRTNRGFEVREQQGGKSSLTFSYRVVARRKDIEGKRLAKVTLPSVPSLAEGRKPPTPKTSTAAPSRRAKET
jgi:hypothetical protein